MSNKLKDKSINNNTYYFFDGIINIKNFDSNNIKIEYKNILIYHIGYVTIKNSKYVKINNVNLLCLFQQSEWKPKKKIYIKNCGVKSKI